MIIVVLTMVKGISNQGFFSFILIKKTSVRPEQCKKGHNKKLHKQRKGSIPDAILGFS